jgi:hypothetical protein
VPTLKDLAAEPVWVAWANEERGGKPTKVPYQPLTGSKAASDDPSTWGKRWIAEWRAKRIVNGLRGGIGVILGVDCGDGAALGGIDLDSCRDVNGHLADWATELIARFGSYAEVSPSGTGAKIFFRYRIGDLPRVRQLMGTESGRQFKWRTGDDHPPGSELYISHRYFAVTNEGIDPELTELRLVDFDDLEWLVKQAGPAFVADDPNRRGGSNGHDRSGLDQSRSVAAFRVGLRKRRAAQTFDQFRQALQGDPDTASWYREKGIANGERELHRIWDKAEETAIAAVTLDDFYAYMPQHNYIFAPTGETWPAASVNIRIPPMPLVDDNGAPVLNNKGEQIYIPAATWIDKKWPVEQMTWWPGKPQIIADRLTSHAGWINRPRSPAGRGGGRSPPSNRCWPGVDIAGRRARRRSRHHAPCRSRVPKTAGRLPAQPARAGDGRSRPSAGRAHRPAEGCRSVSALPPDIPPRRAAGRRTGRGHGRLN